MDNGIKQASLFIRSRKRAGASRRKAKYKSVSIREKNTMPTNFETSFRLFRKLLPLVRWYLVSGTLVVMATAFLTWGNDCLSGQDDLLMVFLGSILMLTILFCLPLAIMNCLSKDYFFTVAVSVLAFFMVRAHFTVMDTLGVDNIQMQTCLLFLGVCLCGVIVTYIKPLKEEIETNCRNQKCS